MGVPQLFLGIISKLTGTGKTVVFCGPFMYVMEYFFGHSMSVFLSGQKVIFEQYFSNDLMYNIFQLVIQAAAKTTDPSLVKIQN